MTTPKKPLPPCDALGALFTYDATEGKLFWRVSPSRHSRVRAGCEAGHQAPDGYRRVGVKGWGALAVHRVIWKMATGKEPEAEVDHINGDKTDNRWRNLRAADRAENRINSRPLARHRGTYFVKSHKKWSARIERAGQVFWLGYFDTPEQACAAYRAKAVELHGTFLRSGECGCG